MAFWRTFHSLNEDLVFILGFTLNIMLLIVIKKVRIKLMQKYNILLLQCCCVDMFQLLTNFIVKPIYIIHKRSLYYMSNGFLRPIGGWAEVLGICLWATSVCFCVCSMPVSFIFRYRILCLNAEISKKFYVISLTVAFLSASTMGIIVLKFQHIDNHHLVYLAEEAFPWLVAESDGRVRAVCICPAVSLSDSQNSKFNER